MKQKICFLVLAVFISQQTFGADSFFSIAKGTSSGSEDVALPASYQDSFDHEMSGQAAAFTYGSFEGGGWGWVVGYQSYYIEGKASENSRLSGLTFNDTLESSLSLVGPQIGFGYLFDGFIRFVPQVRLGISNQMTAKRKLTTNINNLVSISFKETNTSKSNVMFFVFPVEMTLGKSISVGVEYHYFNTNFEIAEDTLFGDSSLFIFSSATLVSLNYLF